MSIGGLHAKLLGPKIVGVPGENVDVGPMERYIVYYKGEGGDFP
jgi:hypothetical protein